jgi:AhpD family alkylhydroperoxidase
MNTTTALSTIDQELVAVGASVAAGCRPCTAYHIEAARKAGAADEAIRRAVDTALYVRETGAEIMASWADELLTGNGLKISDSHQEQGMYTLVAIAAAHATNCETQMEMYLKLARSFDVQEAQITEVLRIARMVKSEAGKKVEAPVKTDAPVESEAKASSGSSGCGCASVDSD